MVLGRLECTNYFMRLICEDEWIITQIKLLPFFDTLLPHLGTIKFNAIRTVKVTNMMLTISIGDDTVITRDITIRYDEVTVFVLTPSTDNKSRLVNHIALLIEP